VKHFLLSLTMLACGAKIAPQAAQDSTPVLPAPEANVYTLAPSPPADFLVATVANGLPFDDALAGAASGLAIPLSQDQGFDSADLSWACVRAGWPYPLSDMRSLTVDKDAHPEGLLAGIELSPTSRIGLVRARSANSDTWVFLQSEVLVKAQPFEKTQTLNTRFPNPFSEETALNTHLLSPTGHLYSLEKEQVLDETGEWLLESHQNGTLVLRAALFVDMKAPQNALIPYQAELPPEEDPTDLAALILSDMHRLYLGTEKALRRETSLDTSARMALKAWKENQALTAAHVRFEKLGYVREPRGEVLCSGATVRACLDNLYWSIPLRKELLSEGHDVMGIAASQDKSGNILLMINLAAN
jgi:hypothetical protein